MSEPISFAPEPDGDSPVAEPVSQPAAARANCAECGTGLIAPADAEGPVYCPQCTKQRIAYAELRAHTRLVQSGMPEKWVSIPSGSRSREGQGAAFTAAQAWVRGQGQQPGLLLYGPTGRGKTYTAALAAGYLGRTGRLRWVHMPTAAIALRLPFSSRQYESALSAFTAKPGIALILDDLDVIAPAPHALEPLYVLINQCIELGIPLLATSRNAPAGIARRLGEEYGPPIASRLVEHCLPVEMSGADHRQRPGGSVSL